MLLKHSIYLACDTTERYVTRVRTILPVMPFHLPHLEDIISRLRAASYAVRLYGGIATLCGLNTVIVHVILLLRHQFIYVLY